MATQIQYQGYPYYIISTEGKLTWANPAVYIEDINGNKQYASITPTQHLVPVPEGLQIGNFIVPSNGMFDIISQTFEPETSSFTFGVDNAEKWAEAKDLCDYYSNLLILQYRNKPKANATIKAIVPTATIDGLPQEVENAFDIETAVGKQLDILGKYIGFDRNVKLILPETGSLVLEDEEYRLLLKLKIITNNGRATTGDIKTGLYKLFPTQIRLFDNRDMTYTYFVDTSFSNLMNVIVSEELLPLPEGVGYKLIVVQKDITKFFGYSHYNGINNNPNGFTRYSQGFRNYFLRYKDRFTQTGA